MDRNSLGLLMDIFRGYPNAVADLYELSIIRRSGPGEEEEPEPPMNSPPMP